MLRTPDRKKGIIVVADGAGSAPLSHHGAELATRHTAHFLLKHFTSFFRKPDSEAKVLLEYLLTRFHHFARNWPCSVKELACTLLFVAVKRRGRRVLFVGGHLGDGVIACGHRRRTRVLSHPHRGEFANETVFLTSKHAARCFRYFSGVDFPPLGFMAMTDGAAETLYIRRLREINQKFARQIFQWADHYPQERLQQIIQNNLNNGIFRQVTHDDCGLAVLRIC